MWRMSFFSTVASDEMQEEALAFIVKNLRMKTNWGKSQLPPEIFTADCLPLLRNVTSKNTPAQCQHWGWRLRNGRKPL